MVLDPKAVDWAAIDGAYGPATKVPNLLARLTDKKKGKAALRQLANLINHQGTPTPAAIEVTPFLVELAGSSAVADRAGLVVLLGELAAGGDHTRCLETGFDANDARFQAAPDDHPLKHVHMSVSAGVEHYLALLEAESAGERSAAAFALAFMGLHAERCRPIVAAAVERESKETSRATALLSLAYLSRYASSQDAEPFRDWYERGGELMKICAAISMAILGLDLDQLGEAGAAEAVLLDCVETHRKPIKGLPFCEGELANFAVIVLSDVGHARGDAEMLLRLVETADGLLTKHRALHAHVEVVFGAPDGRRMRLWSELSDQQQALLRSIIERNDALRAGSMLASRGIWGTDLDLRRFCGMTPAGPLDEVAEGDPLWRLCVEALHDTAARRAWIEALNTLPEEERLAVGIDALDPPYNLFTSVRAPRYDRERREREELVTLFLAETLAVTVGPAMLQHECERLAGADPPSRHCAAFLVARARAGVGASAAGLSAIYKQALHQPSHSKVMREALEVLPDDERESIILSLDFDHFRDEDRPQDPPVMWSGWVVADLCPTEAIVTRIIEAIDGWSKYDAPYPVDYVTDLLTGFGQVAKAAVTKAAATADESVHEIYASVLRRWQEAP